MNINISKYIHKVEPMDRIGKVFAKNRLNLIHGIQGSGKSYSTIKALNKDNIVPIHINLDESTGFDDLNVINVYEKFLLDLFSLQFNKDDFVNDVILVDTYTRFESFVFSRGQIKDKDGVFKLIESTQKHYKNLTMIIIGHTQPFVGRDGIFNDNLPLVRGCAEELWLEKALYKATKARPAYTDYILHICKGRGYNDDRDIKMWMRN